MNQICTIQYTCRHVIRDRAVTDYIRKRLSVPNEKNWSRDRALWDPRVRSEGEDFTSFTLTVVSCLTGKNKNDNIIKGFKGSA